MTLVSMVRTECSSGPRKHSNSARHGQSNLLGKEEIKWGIQILVLYMLFSAAIHLRAKIKPAYKTHRPQLLFPTLASVRKPIETMGVVPRDTSIWIPFTMWYMM